YWKETFFVWFDSVKRHFPVPLRDEFRAQAEADFAIVREKAAIHSDIPWQQLKDCIERPVRFRDREVFEKACKAAEEKFPVDLGIAIDKYLLACVQRLLNAENSDAPLV